MMFFTVYVLGEPGFFSAEGLVFGKEATSITTYTAVVLLQLATVAMESHTFTM